MPTGIKISLPTYNAETDTNLDHFSLWVSDDDSVDNVLIKEFSRGSASIAASLSVPYEIAHNLGYIPFFLVFAYYENHLGFVGVPEDKWVLVPSLQISASVQPFYIYADTSKIYIWNFDDAVTPSNTTFKWFIFYDRYVGSDAPSISESDYGIKVSKAGIDASVSTNPNDYIFHSDLNTFKILKESVSNVTYTADGLYTVAHGLSSYSPTAVLLFVEFPDGYVGMSSGLGRTMSRDGAFELRDCYVDSSNIGFYLRRLSGSATSLQVKYFIFETPL